MTIIEFFDKASIENIAGALLCSPEAVILVGDKKKQLDRAKDLYRGILEKNRIGVDISVRTVNKNNLQDIVAALSQIAEDFDDCVFDLTGGEELYLGISRGLGREISRIYLQIPNKRRDSRFMQDRMQQKRALFSLCICWQGKRERRYFDRKGLTLLELGGIILIITTLCHYACDGAFFVLEARREKIFR